MKGDIVIKMLIDHFIDLEPSRATAILMGDKYPQQVVINTWERIDDNIFGQLLLILLIIKFDLNVNAIIDGERVLAMLCRKQFYITISTLLLSGRIDPSITYELPDEETPLGINALLSRLLPLGEENINCHKNEKSILGSAISEHIKRFENPEKLPQEKLIAKGNALLIEKNNTITQVMRGGEELEGDMYDTLSKLSTQYTTDGYRTGSNL